VSPPPTQPDLSLVIPVFDEEGSLDELYRQIVAACDAAGKSFEIVFIDDGSRDGSPAKLAALAAADPRVRVIEFRRNFGKSPALAAGFERVRGRIVFTLDADLQDDPAMIPRFLEKIDAGADLVSGWKQRRHDPLGKTLPSKLFNGVVRRWSGVQLNDFNCGFKAYRVECIRELSVYGGFHRFLPVLAGARGFRVAEVVVEHRPRVFGVSKFGVTRMFDGLMDFLTVLLVTRYRTRPLHFFGGPGIAFGVSGLAILLYLTVLWFLGHPIGTRPLLTLGVLLTITSVQFVALGLVAELLVRTTVVSSEIYSIRREFGGSAPTTPGEAASPTAAAPNPSLPT
jgi:glycosyltransferase involved in cell wall biosynthesis